MRFSSIFLGVFVFFMWCLVLELALSVLAENHYNSRGSTYNVSE